MEKFLEPNEPWSHYNLISIHPWTVQYEFFKTVGEGTQVEILHVSFIFLNLGYLTLPLQNPNGFTE